MHVYTHVYTHTQHIYKTHTYIHIKHIYGSIYSSITTQVMPMEKCFSRQVDWEEQLTHLISFPPAATVFNTAKHQDRLHLNPEGGFKVQNRRSGLRWALS